MGDLVGTADHYSAFVKLARLRIEQLGLTFESVDALCGFPARYTGKLLAGDKSMSVYSLFTLARGLALLPAFHHDNAQQGALQRHSEWILSRRPGPKWRRKIDRSKIELRPDFLRNRAAAGGMARALKLKAKRRREIARNAVGMRKWRPVRSATNS
jgi:hypothetical protein